MRKRVTTVFHPQCLFEREKQAPRFAEKAILTAKYNSDEKTPSAQDPTSKPAPPLTIIPEQLIFELPYRASNRPTQQPDDYLQEENSEQIFLSKQEDRRRYSDPYRTLPPKPVSNERLDPQLTTQFIRMYDKNKLYSGEPYDLLEDKMRQFLSICRHAGIRPGQFYAVFPRILTGRTENFYLYHIDQESNFATTYNMIKKHFGTEVNH